MWQQLIPFLSGDGRAAPIALGLGALLVIVVLAVVAYRLLFAHRLRAPGAARGRAPRLGVVDVFPLDAQRQLVIVRRDNVEHLLMIGGPNDVVVEPHILRVAGNGANGREAAKPAPVEPVAESPRPTAPPSRSKPPLRAVSPEPPAVAIPEPEPSRPEPAEPPRPRPAPSRAEPAAPRIVAVEPEPKAPDLRTVDVKPVEAKPAEIRPVEGKAAAEAKPAEPKPAEAKPAEVRAVEPREIAPPRKPLLPPRPVPAAAARPNLPSPITPLRPAPLAKPASEAAKTPEVLITPPPPAPATPAPIKEKERGREETFYDLESLEAEMARLLGRDA